MSNQTEATTYLTPVEFAKVLGIPPQHVYGHIKRGMPTHEVEHKGKMRALVDPAEANDWLAAYDVTKRHRRSTDNIETDADGNVTDSPRDGKQRATNLATGQLVTYERRGGHITVAKVTKADEHFVFLRKNCYMFPFILHPTQEREMSISHDTIRHALRSRQMILDTPLQVLQYAIDAIRDVNPDMAEAIEKATKVFLEGTEELVEVADKSCYNYNGD